MKLQSLTRHAVVGMALLGLSSAFASSETTNFVASIKSSPNYSVLLADARGKLMSFEVTAATRALRADQKKTRMLDIIERSKSMTNRQCSAMSCLGMDIVILNQLSTVETLVKQGRFKEAANLAHSSAKTFELI